MIEIQEMTDEQIMMLMLIKLGYRVNNDSLVSELIRELENRLNRGYDTK